MLLIVECLLPVFITARACLGKILADVNESFVRTKTSSNCRNSSAFLYCRQPKSQGGHLRASVSVGPLLFGDMHAATAEGPS